MPLYYNPADNSFWRVDPPAGSVEITNEKDLELVEKCLLEGGHPRPKQGGGWSVRKADDPPRDVRLRALRVERDERLRESDWTQLEDADLTPEQKTQWREYRRALRQLPQSSPDGKNVVWPSRPSRPE